jgi:CRISPR system Cascade subunit CasE
MTLWLTRLTPDLRRRAVLDDFANVRNLHRRVMSLFPEMMSDRPRAELGVLFRVENENQGIRVLLQSAVPPDGTRLPADYGAITPPVILKGLLDALTDGVTVRYRITANPFKQLPRGYTAPATPDPKNGGGILPHRTPKPGDRIPLYGQDAEHWWHGRARSAGLSLQSATMTPRQPLTDVGPRGSRLRLACAQFDGTAVIADANAVRSAVTDGIGQGKPYGCGLLSLIPMR